MKKIVVLMCCILLLMGLIACERPGNTPSSSPSPKSVTTEIALTSIPTIQHLHAEDVLKIDYFNDSVPPDTPARTYSATQEIQAQLEGLQRLRLLKHPEKKSSADLAPGAWSRYDIHCFDGQTISVSFSMDTLSFGQGYYTFEGRPAAKKDPDIWLQLDQTSYPVGISEASISIYNHTGDTIAVVFVPSLERATRNGWEKVPCEAGACGTPDPLDETVSSLPLYLSDWYPSIGPGTYRLTLTAYDAADNPYILTDIFTLTGKKN